MDGCDCLSSRRGSRLRASHGRSHCSRKHSTEIRTKLTGNNRISVSKEPISIRPHKVWWSSLPQCTVSFVKGCRSLWKWAWERLPAKPLLSCQGPFSGEPGHTFLQGFLGLQTVHMWTLNYGPRLHFAMIQCSLPFICLIIFLCLFLSYFTPGNTMIDYPVPHTHTQTFTDIHSCTHM